METKTLVLSLEKKFAKLYRKCYKKRKGKTMRTNPHVLEINTRAWLKRLEAKHGRPFTLRDIPDTFLDLAQGMGFDAVWLMGVWKESPAAKTIAQNSVEIQNQIHLIKPDFKKEDITASPYAVYDYTVDDSLGGNDALADFRKRLQKRGIHLLLDFVGNHMAIDAPVVTAEPDLFINTGTQEPANHKDWFFKTPTGVYVAHGRDPYFAPWTDTAQLNYFNPKTREFMLNNLRRVAQMCDGVRCDMAMLSLNKVHRDTWWEFIGGELPKEEFWRQALVAIRNDYPEFAFIAEVYWGLEWEVQELGFDYTYDKVLYDRLRFSSPEDIKGHLRAEHLYQMRSLRFTSNHDEEESLKAFGREKSLAASTIIATLPGARLFHLFQLLGRPARMPLQYVQDWFTRDEEVLSYYKQLLRITSDPAFHGGQWSLCEVLPGEDGSNRNILAWQWKQMSTGKLIVINYSHVPAQGRLPLKGVRGPEMTEEFSGSKITLTERLQAQGLPLDLRPYESKIFTFQL